MMTPQNPPPQPYGGFGAPGHAPPPPYAPVQPPRPSTGLKVLAVVQIVFGALGVIGAPIGLLMANLQLSKDPVQQKLHDALWEGPAAIWSYSSGLIGFVLAVLLIASGAGLWRAKRWSRTTGLIYGAGSLAMFVIGQLVMMLYVYPMLMEQLDATNPVHRAGAMGGMIGGLVGGLFGAILPVVTLIVLGRASTKAQLS